jgi:hypothetical protein
MSWACFHARSSLSQALFDGKGLSGVFSHDALEMTMLAQPARDFVRSQAKRAAEQARRALAVRQIQTQH